MLFLIGVFEAQFVRSAQRLHSGFRSPRFGFSSLFIFVAEVVVVVVGVIVGWCVFVVDIPIRSFTVL